MSEPKIKCNYLGLPGSGEKGVKEQFSELKKNGLSIKANPADSDSCYYYYKEEDRYIAPVSFKEPYIILNGTFDTDSKFALFNLGEPKEINPNVKKHLREGDRVYEFAVFAIKNVSTLNVDNDNVLNFENAMMSFLRTKGFADLMFGETLVDNEFKRFRTYTVQIGGSNLPEIKRALLPPAGEKSCPEYALHQSDISSAIAIDGWGVVANNGGFVAIPRFQLPEKGLDAAEAYKKDLQEKLKGIRNQTAEIEYLGQGETKAFCPMFKVVLKDIELPPRIVERPKRKKVPAKPIKPSQPDPKVEQQKAEERQKKMEEMAKTSVKAVQEGYKKYTETKKRLEKMGRDLKLAEERRKAKEEADKKRRLAEEAAEAKRKAYEERLKRVTFDDLKPTGNVEFYEWSEKDERLEEIAKATGGSVHIVPWDNYGKINELIIQNIKEAIKLKEKADDYQVVFLVDASGSMSNDLAEVRDNGTGILNHLKKQVKDGGSAQLGIRSFVDNRFKTWLSLTNLTMGRLLFSSILDSLGEYIGAGGLEPVWDALVMAMKEEEWKTDPNVKKKIIVLMDEPGDLTNTGYNKDFVYAMARKLGIVIEIVALPPDFYGCFSGETFVLTEKGVATMNEIAGLYNKRLPLPAIATMDEPTSEIEYQVPDIVFEHDRPNGERFLNISEDTELAPLEVTPNHQMFVREKGEADWLEAGSVVKGASELYCPIGCEKEFETVEENEPAIISGPTKVYNIHFNDVEGEAVNHNYLVSPDGVRWFVAHNKIIY